MRPFISVILLLALSACQSSPASPTPAYPTATPPTGEPQVFVTATPTLLATSAARPSPAFTHTPLPTATPFMHIVKRGETMLGIALFYGVELAALKAANPTVDPSFMSVGAQLVIPLVGATVPTDPTPTPAPLSVGAPSCFPGGDGALWCGLLLDNPAALALENISVLVDFVGPDGALLASQVVFPPLNRLPAGGTLGMAVHFPGLANARGQAYAVLRSAAPVGEESARYLPASVAGQHITLAADKRQASFSVQVDVADGAQTLWAAVLGLDAKGRLVGLRKLTFEAVCPPAAQTTPEPCAPVVFDGTLYSAGPEIETVTILVEARP